MGLELIWVAVWIAALVAVVVAVCGWSADAEASGPRARQAASSAAPAGLDHPGFAGLGLAHGLGVDAGWLLMRALASPRGP